MCEIVLNLPPEQHVDAFARSLLTGKTEITTQSPRRVRRLVNSFGRTSYTG